MFSSLFLLRYMFVQYLALEHTFFVFFTPNYISARKRKPITLAGASPKPNHSEVLWGDWLDGNIISVPPRLWTGQPHGEGLVWTFQNFKTLCKTWGTQESEHPCPLVTLEVTNFIRPRVSEVLPFWAQIVSTCYSVSPWDLPWKDLSLHRAWNNSLKAIYFPPAIK